MLGRWQHRGDVSLKAADGGDMGGVLLGDCDPE
jgi:hypothetical protein